MDRARFGRMAAAVALAAALVPASLVVAGDDEASQQPVAVGVASSFFRDVPEPLVASITQPFSALLEAQTGVPGRLVPGGDPLTIGRQLMDNKLQLAVLHGIEYAWVHDRYPEIRPLMIAVNQQRHLRANLVVRSGSETHDFACLEGKCLALPKGTREHCRVFLQKHCKECGKDPGHLFGKITSPPNVEEALDDVVDGGAQACVVDGVSLDCFKRRKPGRFNRLRVAVQSEVFPAGVLAYRPGAMPEETVRRFRDGMINADRSPVGRQLMTLWRLTGFEDVPADYDQVVAAIVKAYPPPATEGSQKSAQR